MTASPTMHNTVSGPYMSTIIIIVIGARQCISIVDNITIQCSPYNILYLDNFKLKLKILVKQINT